MIYTLVKQISKLLSGFLEESVIIGKENITRKVPVIVVANRI